MMRWVCVYVWINRRIWGLAKQGRMNRESYHDRHHDDDDDDDNHYENSTGQKKNKNKKRFFALFFDFKIGARRKGRGDMNDDDDDEVG